MHLTREEINQYLSSREKKGKMDWEGVWGGEGRGGREQAERHPGFLKALKTREMKRR